MPIVTMRSALKQARLFATRRQARAHAMPLALQMKAAGIPTPETEVRFDRIREWRFDYAWTGWKIALEVEGGIWIQGRHVTGSGFSQDCEKYNRAAILGWLLLRVTPEMVDDGRTIDWLAAAFSARGLE